MIGNKGNIPNHTGLATGQPYNKLDKTLTSKIKHGTNNEPNVQTLEKSNPSIIRLNTTNSLP